MYRSTSNVFLSQPIAEHFDPDLVQRFDLGTVVTGVDPYWGSGTFVYGKAGAAITAIGRLSMPDQAMLFGDVPNTVGTGFPVFINIYPMAIGEFGWFQAAGNMIMQAASAVAADAVFGVAAAGQAGAIANGKQILGARCRLPVTTTVAKTNCIVAPGGRLKDIVVPGIEGWFHGVTLSGTGIPASSTVTAINPSRHVVTMSGDATAAGQNVTVTATYTGFIVAFCNNPHVQGQVV